MAETQQPTVCETMPTKPKAKAQAKKTKPKPTAEQIANRADRKTNSLRDRADTLVKWISQHDDCLSVLQNKIKLLTEKYEKLTTEYNALVTEHNKLIDQYAALKQTTDSTYDYGLDTRRKLHELERLIEKLRTSPRGNHATAKELADLHGIVTEHAEQTRKVIEVVQQQIRDVVDVRNSIGGGI